MTTEVVTSWASRVEGRNIDTQAAGRWRAIRAFDALGPAGALDSVGPVVSFASNDYLGLTVHSAVIAAAHAALDRWGAGSGGSRLITGARPVHAELEQELAEWKGTDASLLFPTGFAANLGVLSALARPGTLVCSDELNHASIIDGCRLAKAETRIYRHRDVAHLAALLGTADGPAIVVSDTVFSMDGDVAPVDELAEVCARHDALLVLDDAHSVLGPDPHDLPCEVVRVGTLSKTLGSLGGFVAASRPFVDLLINEARTFIFTTASSPADAAAALAALRIVRGTEGAALVATLRGHVDRVARGNPSPIVPVVIGAEGAAVAASASLLAQGLFVPAIRPPTVAPGTSRLRVALSAAHTDDDIDRLIAGLGSLDVPS
ncbi:MAG: aminotransferase class I/II-fold pyridoxal phosphate-dependent enzyme [Microthrixaceae bacterium]